MASKKNPFFGRWRITEMEQWDSDYIDEEDEGYIEFGRGEQGDFQFGYVHGSMDCEIVKMEGKPRIEFSWEGNVELEEASGRGWAVVEKDGSLCGRITMHMGERSRFKALKSNGSR
jgi:hypothetical protein